MHAAAGPWINPCNHNRGTAMLHRTPGTDSPVTGSSTTGVAFASCACSEATNSIPDFASG
jgi:hypothetical protein